MSDTIVGIDVGTTKVCTLIAEQSKESGRLRIIGVGIAPSRGLRKGVVINVEEATEAIKESKLLAERSSGYSVQGAYVSVAGDHISSLNSRGVVAVSRPNRGVEDDDIQRSMDSARAIAIPQNREVIHAIPRSYTLDGVDGIRDPLGMRGFRLEVEAHIVTASVPSIHNIINCVEAAGVAVNDLVLEPLASGESVLREDEKQAGVILADVGGGTTDIGIFIDGSIWHSHVLPVGGWQYTNDLTIGLRAPFAVAEVMKIQHGSVFPEPSPDSVMIDVAAFGDSGHKPVPRAFVSEILSARAEEMFELILKEVKRSGYDGLLPAGLVLTGGTAELKGLSELGRQIMEMPVRTGQPHDLEGLTDKVNCPAYATSVGLLLWGLNFSGLSLHTKSHEQQNWGKRLSEWLENLFPRQAT